MEEIAKAVAQHNGLIVNWKVETPRRLQDDLEPLCNAADQYLLDHPGETITITIGR